MKLRSITLRYSITLPGGDVRPSPVIADVEVILRPGIPPMIHCEHLLTTADHKRILAHHHAAQLREWAELLEAE